MLNQARAFYLDFFLAHAGKLAERVTYYSEAHLEMRERLISAHELLSWAEGASPKGFQECPLPAAADHPTLYQGCIMFDLETLNLQETSRRHTTV